MSVELTLVAVVVGMLIGAVGIGGILLIPAVNLLAGLPVQAAMATALFTFVFTGILGTFLFNRRGSIDWPLTIPLCLGAAAFGFLGAWTNSRMDGQVLMAVLSVLIIVAGVNSTFKRSSASAAALHASPRKQRILLLCIGSISGFGSGLTGVGGPALSVPLMLLCGFPPLTAIGASQVIQIVAAVSGTSGNLRYGSIDFPLALALTVFEIVGVHIGVRMVHVLDAGSLRGTVGVICMLAGGGLMMRSLGVL
jgi:uncharacterized membrane protein YfcA